MLRPPVGVALLGFVALMAGFAFLIIGFRYAGYVVFGRGDLGDGLFLWGVLAIISGVLFIAAAFSLWATQPWGWLFAHYLAIFGLIEAVFVMIANNSITDGIAVALFPLLVIWYLNDKDVKATFNMESLR
jgi:cytochrome c oxidase subunit IV